MRNPSILILVLITHFSKGQSFPPRYDNPPKVMVLGTYHMANPGQDAANVKADDVKTEKRQSELEKLAELLAEFRPTKIAIEAPFQSEKFQDRYQQFASHGHVDSLSRNERQQIGYRLAYKLGHDKIYPIDHSLDIMSASFQEVLKNNPDKTGYVQSYTQKIQQFLDKQTKEMLYPRSITEYLAFMNSKEMTDLNHAIYMEFLRDIYHEENYGGADMLTLWYKRNLYIFQNLTRITDFDDPDERILVIFGQGHSKFLMDLIDEASYYELVNVLDYIAK